MEVCVVEGGLGVAVKHEDAILGMFGDDLKGFMVEGLTGIGIWASCGREFGTNLVAVGI